jgi:hypothetical protein
MWGFCLGRHEDFSLCTYENGCISIQISGFFLSYRFVEREREAQFNGGVCGTCKRRWINCHGAIEATFRLGAGG